MASSKSDDADTVRMRWIRVLPILFLAGIASFIVGIRFVAAPRTPSVHPVTGRVIPGVATDAQWLDRVERDQEEAPDRALALIGVDSGASVADVGAGTGYMTIRLARLVGPTGRVYANEIQPAMLRLIEQRVRQEQLGNVVIVQGTDRDARIPGDTLDLALLVDVYHELHQPQAMLASIRRSLRRNGRLVLVENRKEDPTIPIIITHRMSTAEARAEIDPEGFKFDHATAGLPRQHIIVFRRSDAP
jgi:predicted methyltransferase